MNRARREEGVRLSLALPVVVVVLGLTAVQPHHSPSASDIRSIVHLRFDPIDVVANLILFLPLGIVMARRGLRATVLVAAATSVLAETTQVWSTTRNASAIDIVVNVAGAVAGWCLVIATGWDASSILVTKRRAMVALGLAVGCAVFGASSTPKNIELDLRAMVRREPQTNPRGSSEPGRLEGQWAFDGDPAERVVIDSADGSDGQTVGDPDRATGVHGEALVLDGETQYVDVGDRLAFRLGGSMTVTAWIQVDRFPPDDGPIASTLDATDDGFQLDTTIDSGPRVIGFKLGGADERLMARYGATPLRSGVWYHVAGVYDADGKSIHVYLDGRPDDGCLSGSVSAAQRPSTAGLMLGRRPVVPDYRFSGMLDDVRVYSRALSAGEIADLVEQSGTQTEGITSGDPAIGDCVPAPDPRGGGLIVAMGSLVAAAAIGLVGIRHRPRIVGVLAAVALALILWAVFDGSASHASTFGPALLAIVGGVAVSISVHPERERPDGL